MPLSSGGGGGDDKNGTSTNGLGWVVQLQQYMRDAQAQGCSNPHLDGNRKVLCDIVLDNPNSAEAWFNFLDNEEACMRQGSSTPESKEAEMASSSGKAGGVGLHHLYHKATELVQRSKGRPLDAYVKIWVGYARHQWQHNEDEARDTFKTLKNQHIADSNALLFHAWASLEARSGNVGKALGILGKALKEHAQPASILHSLLAQLQGDAFLSQPPPQEQQQQWPAPAAQQQQQQQQQHPKTPHSLVAPSTAGRAPCAALTATPSCPAHPPAQLASGGRGAHLQFKTPVAMPQQLYASGGSGGGAQPHTSHTSHSTASSHSSVGSAYAAGAAGPRFAAHAAAAAHPLHPLSSASPPYPHAELHPGLPPTQPAMLLATSQPTGGSGGACPSEACHTVAPPLSAISSRTLHSLSSSEEDALFQKGSDNTATMTSATAALGADLSMQAEGSEACRSAHAHAHTQGTGGGGLTARGDANHTGGVALNLTGGLSGNHTSQMGIKRFGFKSKALRVTHATGQGSGEAGGGGDAAAGTAAAVAMASAGEEGLGAGDAASDATAATVASMDGSGDGGGADEEAATPLHAAACSAGHGARSLLSGGEGSTSRKRRAGGSGHYSPRNPAAVAEDGAKRRTSPPLLQGMAVRPPGDSAGGEDFAFPQLGGSTGASPSLTAAAAPAHGESPPTLPTHLLPASSRPHAATHAPADPPHPTDATPAAPAVLQPRLAHPQTQQRTPPPQHHAPCPPAAAAHSGSKLKQQGRVALYAPGSENEAPAVPLQQALGVAATKPHAPLPVPQPKQGAGAQALPTPKQQQPPLQHREPLRVVQAPVTAQPSPAAAAVATRRPELHQAEVVQQQVQQVQQARSQQQAQQQQVGAVASSAPDLRAAPPERLPEPQRRALEDANWVYVNGLRYQKLDCVGRGGSSKVFKVLGCNRQIYALKRVRLANKDPEAIRGFIDEITLLKQLRATPNIIQLISAQVFREECLIYMVLEYGDIDLARLLQNHEEARRRQQSSGGAACGGNGPASAPGGSGEIDENFIRLYWQQMLQAVGGIHELRIVHSDLKPANFLLVQGQLKLIDFGIAKSIQGDTTSINRESQVGTLNYMSPEAIQGGSSNPLGGPPLKVGRPSDVWSLGCILYQMVYGQTPFADIPFIPKMNAICNPNHNIRFGPCTNPAAADAMARCLDRNPRTRITIPELLDHAFLHPERAVVAAPAGGGVSEEQLKSIVSQIALAGASGTADIDTLTRQVLAQLKNQPPNPHASRQSATAPNAPAAPLHAHRFPRPPTPARCPIPLSPAGQGSPMEADTPPAAQKQGAKAREEREAVDGPGSGDGAVTPNGSGASAAALRLERLHFEDDASSS